MKNFPLFAVLLGGLLLVNCAGAAEPGGREASFYQKLADRVVRCFLCPRACTIKPGKYGFCRARKNADGTLLAVGYARPCSVGNDPIEKKPFFHFLPGTSSFSIASAGCSLRCQFCQNWEISQRSPDETANRTLSPEQVVESALKLGSPSIAYTYSEPMNFYEYMFDTAQLARKRGLRNVVHTSGFVNTRPLEQLCPYLDAANVDLKGFSEDYYRRVCGGQLAPVLQTLKTLRKNHVWIEITNLVVPGYNDTPDEIRRMCLWIRDNLGPDTPLHFSRFHPTYQMVFLPPTPVSALEKAAQIARETGLRFVYIGNVPDRELENTVCPGCHKLLIRRQQFVVLENHLNNGKCAYCGRAIPGVWK